jgi:deoxyribonuclease V
MTEIIQPHPWNVTFREAVEIQKALRPRLVFKKLPKTIRHIAGADVSFSKRSNMMWAALVVLTYPNLEKTDQAWAERKVSFPYVPGLLSFREIPLLLDAFTRLEKEPDVILCDGQGIAHPRGMGLASHLGLLINKPTIGCAKTRLVGDFAEVGPNRGDYSHLLYRGEKIGAVVRTRTNVKPVFVSPGYAVKRDDAVSLVLKCAGPYRIPEPIRKAHLLANRLRQEGEAF